MSITLPGIHTAAYVAISLAFLRRISRKVLAPRSRKRRIAPEPPDTADIPARFDEEDLMVIALSNPGNYVHVVTAKRKVLDEGRISKLLDIVGKVLDRARATSYCTVGAARSCNYQTLASTNYLPEFTSRDNPRDDLFLELMLHGFTRETVVM